MVYSPPSVTSILIVEDNTVDVILVKKLLTDAAASDLAEYPRLTFAEAKTLKEAIKLLDAQRYDVCLLDLNLPDAHDLYGLKILVRDYPWLPIVVYTGIYQREISHRTMKAGAQDCIGKLPVPLQDREYAFLILRILLHSITRQRDDLEYQEYRRLKNERSSG